MLSRNEVIDNVLLIYEILDELEHKNDSLVKTIEKMKSEREEKHDSIADAIYKVGKETIAKKVTYAWHSVSCERVDGVVVYKPNNFDAWVKMKVHVADLPEWLSLNDFKEYCSGVLWNRYDEERRQALGALKAEESDESEEESEGE